MPSENTLATKPHYPALDSLRGIAAIFIVLFHIFAANTGNPYAQMVNHCYLAVDFFFVLSGFVIGFAYDNRWDKLTIGTFFKRRLVRLQPMVIFGTFIGAALIYLQNCPVWPEIHNYPVLKILFITLIGSMLIPLRPSWDPHGWSGNYPLDGTLWSLLFEYIANIFYAIGLRKLPKTYLIALVLIAGGVTVTYLLTNPAGDIQGGWAFDRHHLQIGFIRLGYPFLPGLLLSRIMKPRRVKNALLLCCLALSVLLCIPRIGTSQHVWQNGAYEAICIIILFPLIVYIGAGSAINSAFEKRFCKFMGDISYPIYTVHYPIVLVYTAWVFSQTKVNAMESAMWGTVSFIVTIAVSYLAFKYYDEPVRGWLKRKMKS